MGKTSLRASSLAALGISVGLLSVSQVAIAGDTTISVLGLEAAAGAPEQVAAAVTDTLRQRVASTSGYRLVQGRDLVEVKLVFSCPDEAPACMTQAAQSIGSSKIIFGNVQPVGTDAYLVTLKLLDAERGVVETWISEQITKAQTNSVALRVPVQKWFATLTGQSSPGAIKVTGGVVGATVSIDGVQAGLLAADGLTIAGVAAGPHQLAVTKAGYEKTERAVTLASGGLEKVVIQLKPIEVPSAVAPEAVPTAEPAGENAAAPTGTEPEPLPSPQAPNQGSRVGAWALLGLGMVGVGLGGYFSYKVTVVNSNLDPYRRYPCPGTGAQTCNADGTQNHTILTTSDFNYSQSEQNTGNNYAKLQWVGYGVGGVLLVTSGVLFYRGYFAKPTQEASNKRRTNLIVLPAFAPNSVGALAFLRF
jgi:hypothetical protein